METPDFPRWPHGPLTLPDDYAQMKAEALQEQSAQGIPAMPYGYTITAKPIDLSHLKIKPGDIVPLAECATLQMCQWFPWIDRTHQEPPVPLEGTEYDADQSILVWTAQDAAAVMTWWALRKQWNDQESMPREFRYWMPIVPPVTAEGGE